MDELSADVQLLVFVRVCVCVCVCEREARVLACIILGHDRKLSS